MEFPIYYVILDTMLLLHSAFGVFLIALWHACILILAYCWGANNIMKEWIAEQEYTASDERTQYWNWCNNKHPNDEPSEE
tara:strand:+ start:201 stop:440 length:240 start_codon:yes stop_codon:yes gene_type:complete